MIMLWSQSWKPILPRKRHPLRLQARARPKKQRPGQPARLATMEQVDAALSMGDHAQACLGLKAVKDDLRAYTAGKLAEVKKRARYPTHTVRSGRCRARATLPLACSVAMRRASFASVTTTA